MRVHAYSHQSKVGPWGFVFVTTYPSLFQGIYSVWLSAALALALSHSYAATTECIRHSISQVHIDSTVVDSTNTTRAYRKGLPMVSLERGYGV